MDNRNKVYILNIKSLCITENKLFLNKSPVFYEWLTRKNCKNPVKDRVKDERSGERCFEDLSPSETSMNKGIEGHR